jgi:hypothetical protein
MTETEKQSAYFDALRKPFRKLCRLRFLNPDGSTAFMLDNDHNLERNRAFIEEGTISENWQNGQRRTVDVTLSNIDGQFDYNVNNLWFGTEIAVDEGLVLPNGEEYYLPQGVFLIQEPEETYSPNEGRRIQLNLVDKWAMLDGTLYGNLESTYEIPVEQESDIFSPMKALLSEDKGNGYPLDRVPPVFTEYYNGKYQTYTNGNVYPLTRIPYTMRVDSESGTVADVITMLAGVVNAWVGYDVSGALRIDASQDDIADETKPVTWQFRMDETQITGLTYVNKNTEVYNDYIVLGDQLEDFSQPSGRAQNLDENSDTNVQTIGRKTLRVNKNGFGTDTQCQDYAAWKLKRATVLQKSVSVSCSQILHVDGNDLITIVRTDKEGSPEERHLVTGFSRPLTGTEDMTIQCTSVNDFPKATITSWPENPET